MMYIRYDGCSMSKYNQIVCVGSVGAVLQDKKWMCYYSDKARYYSDKTSLATVPLMDDGWSISRCGNNVDYYSRMSL